MNYIINVTDRICQSIQENGKCKDSDCDRCLYENVKEIYKHLENNLNK